MIGIIVGDAASGQMYVQGLAAKTSSTTDLFTGIEANLLVGYLCYYASASTSPPPWVIKDILLVVGFKLCTSKSRACNITSKLYQTTPFKI